MRRRNKGRNKSRIVVVILLLAVFLIGLCGYINQKKTLLNSDSTMQDASTSNITVPLESEMSLQVHFIDVGQGDCSLITCDGEAMLIDAGDNDKGTLVQKYLNNQNITKIKYVIGTHPDADHIGGLDVVIYKFNCENLLMPEATSDAKTYLDVVSAAKDKGNQIKIVGQGDKFTLGTASFEILSPVKEHQYEEDNNNSIVLRLDYKNASFLFTGDTEYQAQQVMYYDDEIDAKADVVKVPHHGANSSYMKAFYDEVNPKYAIISAGKGNVYGHPHDKVLKDLKNRGVKVFRTDEQGTIVATSDGETITFNTEPSNTWETGNVDAMGEGEQSKNRYKKEYPHNVSEKPAEDVTYVFNTRSRKFHKPDCEFVTDTSKNNRVDLTCSREELMQKYPDASPCKNCRP